MDLFMFLVGIFGIIVGIVMLVVNAIRKAPKKKPMVILGLGIMLSMVGLFIPTSADEINSEKPIENNQEETEIKGSQEMEKDVKEETEELEEDTKENEKVGENSVNSNKKTDFKYEAESNTKQYPADSVASFEGNRFKGMKYYYEGTIIDIINIENSVGDIDSWLVKNDRGYLMPVQFEYFKGNIGDKVKIWGTLSGYMYSLEDIEHESIINEVGSMHAMMVEVNGEEQY